MEIVAIAASCCVGAVFLVAGASKLVDGARWSVEARDLGTPRALVGCVPYAEILLGAALVAQVSRVVLSAVALVVLAAFTVLVARVLASGRRPTCACFGAMSRRPLGAGHLVRNGVLMVACVVAML